MIFLRAPQIGAVKRRLAQEVGAGPTYHFYVQTSRDLIRRLGRSYRWRLVLAITPDRFAASARFWPASIPRIAQGPGDLGTRMGRVLARLDAGPVVIVGSDIPGITTRHIERAFDVLARHEAVFGPAKDGGYWLIGLARRRIDPEALTHRLFAGVRWSTSHALADTRANLPRGAEGPALETLEDVDNVASWRRAGGS